MPPAHAVRGRYRRRQCRRRCRSVRGLTAVDRHLRVLRAGGDRERLAVDAGHPMGEAEDPSPVPTPDGRHPCASVTSPPPCGGLAGPKARSGSSRLLLGLLLERRRARAREVGARSGARTALKRSKSHLREVWGRNPVELTGAPLAACEGIAKVLYLPLRALVERRDVLRPVVVQAVGSLPAPIGAHFAPIWEWSFGPAEVALLQPARDGVDRLP